MGQLIAGILLGPSVLGLIWPDLQHLLFPANPAQKAMLDAVSSAPARPPKRPSSGKIAIGRHNLLVMGVNPRSGDQLFFGEVAAEMLARTECSLLFVAGEPFTFETSVTEE